MKLDWYWLDTEPAFAQGAKGNVDSRADVVLISGLGRELQWPAIAAHFAEPWFLPSVGTYYGVRDILH